MYINFKSKYKKIFWILLGFILSCIYVHKVYAYQYYNIDTDTLITDSWNILEGKTVKQIDNSVNSDYVFNQTNYPYVFISKYKSSTDIYNIVFLPYLKPISNIQSGSVSYGGNGSNDTFENYNPYCLLANDNLNCYVSNTFTRVYVGSNSSYEKSATNFDVYTLNGNLAMDKTFDYTPESLPDYLQGYTEITLEPGERYVIFSSSTISSGSVYIPISDFNDYGSRISYFDKDIDTQPYTSYIQDFTTTSDGLYAKQDFDLSSYTGSDFIMFSKYIYLEGSDDFSSSVWVPSEMYSSVVQVTPNNTGGNDFDYSYVDENGELQANVISSSDLSQGSPLISDLFTNFTTKDYGLSSIITAPIPLLQSLNNSSCSPIELPLGVFGGVHDRKLSLPCMTTMYYSTYGELFTLYQTITTGVVAYFVGLAYFNRIKQLKDPDNDSIEVVNL